MLSQEIERLNLIIRRMGEEIEHHKDEAEQANTHKARSEKAKKAGIQHKQNLEAEISAVKDELERKNDEINKLKDRLYKAEGKLKKKHFH